MNIKVWQWISPSTATAIAAIATVSCSQAPIQESQPIAIDGSSTVYPITEAIAQAYQNQVTDAVEISVNFSGTGGGFDKFCAGETDINNASRPIQTDEMAACKQAGVAYIELPVAFDALTVVVNDRNTWATDITLDELKTIWDKAAQGKILKWNQVRPTWPDRPLKLYGPGKDSGTYDYFTEAVLGSSGVSRDDYTASEDDTVLVEGVSNDPDALGYFGYAYYEQQAAAMKAIAVDSGRGAIAPSRKTVENNQYQPLSRPLFIYINLSEAQKNPAMKEFVDFYLDNAPQIVNTIGYVPLPNEGYNLIKVHFNRGKVGTVFGGKSQLNLTIGELLKQEAQF
jgi:phosphate transport system substrate-binding protein